MKLSLDLRLSQKLVMTPQLQQAIKLLQLSKLELTQVISQELVENPLLEEIVQDQIDGEESSSDQEERQSENESEDEKSKDSLQDELDVQWEEYLLDDYDSGRNSGVTETRVDDTPSYEQTLTTPTTLAEHLISQLQLAKISAKEYEIGMHIIGNIDEDGYLRISIEDISKSILVTFEGVEKVLEIIQSMDPSGVAARDLGECLLIQLREKSLVNPRVEQIILHHLKEIESKKYKVIAKSLKITINEVVEVVKIIEGLEPKPGRPFFLDEAQTIIPDVYVEKSGEKFQLVLNDDGMPRLQVSPFYRKLLASKAEASNSTRQYLNDHLKSAVWLIRSIEQRNRTIYKVAESIIKFQKGFFEGGIIKLKPLVLRQVAEDIGMHESTVSRVTTSKYMHTPQGIFEFKFFFSNSLSLNDGGHGELSSITVREFIRQMVMNEEPQSPLRDQEIVDRLSEKDIHIARRTVAKYRAELKIPSASRRKTPSQI